MFEHLAGRYDVIFVTGCQRSGTTICARIIAYDTGHRYVDERDFGCHHIDRLRAIVQTATEPLVVHCPAMSRWVHELGRYGYTAVVFVFRPVDEIEASMERVDWSEEERRRERDKYDNCEIHLPHDRHLAEIKQYYWRCYQQARVANPIEVEYHRLAAHPLWVPTDARVEFELRQWRRRTER